MKIKVAYTIQINDEYRRAIRMWHGDFGLATREEVSAWFEKYGHTLDGEAIANLKRREREGEVGIVNSTGIRRHFKVDHDTPKEAKVYTAREVAELLGVAIVTIRAYCQRYNIGKHFGRDWSFTDADIDVIRQRQAKGPGRPKRSI